MKKLVFALSIVFTTNLFGTPPAIMGDSVFCHGDTIILKADELVTWIFYDTENGNASDFSADGDSLLLNKHASLPPGSYTIYAQPKSSPSTEGQGEFSFRIKPNPVAPQITGKSQLCGETSATYGCTLQEGASVAWVDNQWGSGKGDTLAFGSPALLDMSAYLGSSVELKAVAEMDGCRSEAFLTVYSDPAPDAHISFEPEDKQICNGEVFSIYESSNTSSPFRTYISSVKILDGDSEAETGSQIDSSEYDTGQNLLRYVLSTGECRDTASVSFTVTDCETNLATAIDVHELPMIKVIQSSAGECKLIASSLPKTTEIIVYGLNGEAILRTKKLETDISQLSSGYYFAIIAKNKKHVSVTNFVKH